MALERGRNGGGVFSSAKLVVSKSTFSSNNGSLGQGRGSDGGGIYNSGTATISSSTFTGDVSGVGDGTSGYGGGIANLGTLTLTNSTRRTTRRPPAGTPATVCPEEMAAVSIREAAPRR